MEFIYTPVWLHDVFWFAIAVIAVISFTRMLLAVAKLKMEDDLTVWNGVYSFVFLAATLAVFVFACFKSS